MRALSEWFARNPVAANLLMLVLVAGGLAGLQSIKLELFPEFSTDVVTVTVVHPGASPEEVEESVCVKIEEEVHGIEGVERVTSTAVEGLGTVLVEITEGEDAREVLDDVKARVDAISTLPELAERPVIQEVLMRNQVINVAVYGEVGEARLKELGQRVRDEINALPGISQVELAGARPYEISVELSEADLQRHGLSFEAVADAIRASSLDLSGGNLRSGRGEILLRTKGQAYSGAQFEELVLLVRPDGTRVRLGEVARVVDAFEETDRATRFNGAPAVTVQVFRVGDESALAIAEQVNAYVERTAPTLTGVGLVTFQDSAIWLQGRLDLLLRNGLQGLALVFLALALFLRFRLSVWVTLGIPLSFLGTLMVMPGLDQSINMLTLFAFILVLGIVVDDAIVVGENISKQQEAGLHGVEGAVSGVREVAVPVVFAVLTTVAAFVPIAVLPGIIGKFFGVVPMVVIPALLFSLIESQLVLPAHLAHGAAWSERVARVWPFRGWVRLQEGVARGLERFVRRVYRPFLELALRHRYTTLACALASLLLTLGAVIGGRVKYVFFPNIEGDVVAAHVTMPQGTSSAATAAAVGQIEAAAQELIEEHGGAAGPRSGFKSFMASVGEQPFLSQQRNTMAGGSISGAQYGEVVIELVPGEQRGVTSTVLAARWRELCGPVPGAVALSFDAKAMSPGDPIDIQVTGLDVERLRSVAHELEAALAGYDGVFDVSDSFRGGKQELVFDVLPAGQALGITRAALARQVRAGFHGEEAQRLQRGRDEVKVMVRYPRSDRERTHGIESMRVRAPSGAEVPLREAASVRPQAGSATIQRIDRQRAIRVTADVDLTRANPGEVLAWLESGVLPGILERHPGVSVGFEGQSSDQAEFAGALRRSFALALFAIYALMAIPFRSYLQPAIVMCATPFGLVGAIWGHALLGYDVSSLSMLGIAALAGVVVNDSLVLVDWINGERGRGVSLAEAARNAGSARFRPILLTSLTTFVGLAPLISERSVQAQFLIPMAISLAFGVLFSTLITLLIVPATYLILEDLRAAWRWIYGGRTSPAEGTGLP